MKVDDMEIKALKLDLLDLVSDYTNAGTGYTSYLWNYEERLEALVGLSKDAQRNELENIALMAIASHDRGVWKNAG